ncbi:MAG: NUDIX domain-containing protein [Verrucomicrobiota bacterium]|nr:NUDIX domain-containing protein [Verrucomicrobiota bacterium]
MKDSLPRKEQANANTQDNQSELFDVVDEQDSVLRQAPRGEVHRLGLRHRAVHLFVINTGGYLYLQKRSRFKDTSPGCWNTSAAGHLDAGETYVDAMVREAREEIGITVDKTMLHPILYLPACEELGMEFVWVYRISHEGPFKLLPKEVEAGGWFEPAVIDRWIKESPGDFTVSFGYLWERVRDGLICNHNHIRQ